jgi:hypothetical protein
MMIRFLLVAILGFTLGIAQASDPSGNEVGKKGIGIVTAHGQAQKLEALKVSWFYSWGVDTPTDVPAGMQFIPMIWGWRDGPEQDALFKKLTEESQRGTLNTLLGFNEPDGKDQANLPLETALEKWPMLMSTGLRLGSPACVHPDAPWMRDFMHEADTRNLRVDFITVHWYGGPDADGFLAMLDRIHELYGKPLWITEFAPADWSAKADKPNRFSQEQIGQFMRKVIPALIQCPYVERFAWFSGDPKSPQLGTSALFNEDGSLTPLGQIYAGY